MSVMTSVSFSSWLKAVEWAKLVVIAIAFWGEAAVYELFLFNVWCFVAEEMVQPDMVQ
jgi:hypothetical protein